MDYYFVSKEQFEEWIHAGELLEWALVYGEYKGIPKSQAGAARTSFVLYLYGTRLFHIKQAASEAMFRRCTFCRAAAPR